VVVVLALLGGLLVLAIATQWWIVVPVLAFGVVASIPRLGQGVLQLACAAAFAMLGLIAVAVVVRVLLSITPLDERLPILPGLVLAAVVFGAVVYWYLTDDWAWAKRLGFEVPSPNWRRKGSRIIATVALTLAVIIVLPIVVGLREPDSEPIEQAGDVLSTLDVLVVSEPPAPGASTEIPSDVMLRRLAGPYAHADAFEIRYSVGFREGVGVRWTKTGAVDEAAAIAALTKPDASRVPPPEPANDADRVLVLVVDGTPGGTSTYALLQTVDRLRLRNWTTFVRPGTHVRRGRAVSVQALASRTMTDAAVRLALGTPSAQEDFTLALRYRPILRFDSEEPVPRPLSVERLFAEGKVKQCFDELGGSDCETVEKPRALDNGRTHLDLSLPDSDHLRALARREQHEQAGSGGAPAEPPAPDVAAPPPLTPPPLVRRAELRLGEGSAIYVHPVPVDSQDSRLLYLDYWWYLPENPAGSGAGSFCGPGLVIPGISCFDHESDWEGVTVVLNRTHPRQPPRPVAVHYAQHDSVVRYRWADLRAAWKRNRRTREIRESASGRGAHPLVFVARGTHASYPMPCGGGCRQVAHDVEEKPHNGKLPWVGNRAAACGTETCVAMLPTTSAGTAAALWNAFEGPWGERHCFLTYYCDSTSPPAAPGQQARYEDPTDDDGTYDPVTAKPVKLRSSRGT
jgi:hypothetical protein